MRCFPPVVDKNTKMLFLGSFPGPESLKRREYYGHPQNQFWRLVGCLIKKDLHNMSYSEKISTLRKHRIGLWDVINSCERKGSSDNNIKNACPNQFKKINKLAPNLRLICFNGKTSGRFVNEIIAPEKVVLPSSSPANTMHFNKKLKEWSRACAELSDL